MAAKKKAPSARKPTTKASPGERPSRLRQPKYKKLNLRISEVHDEKLDEVCAKLGLVRSEWVRRAIDDAHAQLFPGAA